MNQPDKSRKPDDQAHRTPDQAEGERDESQKNYPNIGRTPGKAEGDRQTVEEDLRQKEKQGKS